MLCIVSHLLPASLNIRLEAGNLESTNGKSRYSVKWVLCAAMVSAIASPVAYAYRPFEGTDAGVTEAGVFELELGTGYLRQGEKRTVVAPAVVANFGVAGDSEIVLEGRGETRLDNASAPHHASLQDTAISFKHVYRHGSLQNGTGPSIASECGVLLPALHGTPGYGATCAGIVSQRWDMVAVHLNAALTRTREHNWTRFLGAIVEGPEAWSVRLVVEVFAEREPDESRTNSALVGIIWKKNEELAFDLGVRHVRPDDQNITEAMLGLTWNFAMHR